MTPQPSGDPQFESWIADDSPIGIEYSRVVIEEIRQEVAQGMQRFARGGLEVGGVLYGTQEGRRIRVQAMRPIECEHKGGPSFVLSEEDAEKLATRMEEDRQDPQLAGLICVGWFVSHTRGEEISLTASDLEIFSEFFNDPWQVTLVVRPGRAGAMRAAFFVWENDGSVQAERSYKEFNFPDRLAGVLDALKPRGGGDNRAAFRAGPPIPVHSRTDPQPMAQASRAVPTAYDQYMPAPPPSQKTWPWVLAVVAALLGSVGGYVYYSGMLSAAATPEPVALMAYDQTGDLQIQWNSNAGPVRAAALARLDIVDGGIPQTIPLTAHDLSDGRYVYTRKSGDVEVKLVLQDRDEVTMQEVTRFVGRTPEAPVNQAQLDAETRAGELQLELDRLNAENGTLRQQVQQLQRTIRVLESRLDIK